MKYAVWRRCEVLEHAALKANCAISKWDYLCQKLMISFLLLKKNILLLLIWHNEELYKG